MMAMMTKMKKWKTSCQRSDAYGILIVGPILVFGVQG